ncbi:MAG: hypothetical protein AAF726_12105 [Planctomycetota bacterium]
MLSILALACSLLTFDDPELLLTLESPGPQPGFGFAMLPTDDLDGDGVIDLGVPAGSGGDGRFRVFSPVDQSLLMSTSSGRINVFTRWIGDATGDGIGDLLCFDIVGTTGRLSVISSADGSEVAVLDPVASSLGNFSAMDTPFGRAPDVDGDGRSDLWIRTRSSGSGAMNFYEVRSGADPTQQLLVLSGDRDFESVDLLPDRTGDGVQEILVGDDIIESNFPNGTIRGRLRVLDGATGAELLRVEGDDDSRDFGEYARSVGDVTGDGVEDFGASIRRAQGLTVEVFSGADGALVHSVLDPYDDVVPSLQSDFGDAIGAAGDVDGDGIGDFVVGAPGQNPSVTSGGAAHVYSGASGDLLGSTQGQLIGERMGSSVFGLPDLNGDGRDDWFVGSPRTGPQGPSVLQAFGFVSDELVLGFEVGDDLVTPIPNGAALEDVFEQVVRIRSEGAGQVGPAAFDSSPAGPNAGGSDPDLLVDRGNLLILQENSTQSVPGIYDVPDDAAFGGTLVIELVEQREPRSLVLVDICPAPTPQDAVVHLVDAAGRSRTFDVPSGFTTDGQFDPGQAAQTLRLDTLENQPGVTAVATASEDAGFDAARVASIRVELSGSGAVDDVRLGPIAGSATSGVSSTVCVGEVNSTGVGARLHVHGISSTRALTLEAWSVPVGAPFLLLVGRDSSAGSPLGAGTLCLGSQGLMRWPGVVSGGGRVEMTIDYDAMLQSVGTHQPLLQGWYRDGMAHGGSNLTDAVRFVTR